MKNIIEREIFQIFYILLNLILQLFFLVNFPEKKLSKIKSNVFENVFDIYHQFHNFYQSLHFLSKLF